jgi:hypothetical protein
MFSFREQEFLIDFEISYIWVAIFLLLLMTPLQKGHDKVTKIQYDRRMFRKNTRHQQPVLIPYGHDVSAASELPEQQRKRLENSWAGASYKGFFHRKDETVFAVLYSGVGSRPNAA